MDLTVVIVTYNRPELLLRAIRSVEEAAVDYSGLEIIVVDDASTVAIPELPQTVRYFKMPINGGPGPARMKGIELSSNPWVMMLDDDDVFLKNALDYLYQVLPGFESEKFPALQFSVSKSQQHGNMFVADFDNYMNGQIVGEYSAVFSKQLITQSGLSYPNNRAGGEHILWWQLADQFGIPTFDKSLIERLDDAPQRLTDFSSQLRRSNDHQKLAELAIELFGSKLFTRYPHMNKKIRLAYYSYSLLSGNPNVARAALDQLSINFFLKIGLLLVSYLPQKLIESLFIGYRNFSSLRRKSFV